MRYNSAHKSQFDKDGFAIFENLYTPQELNQFENVIRETISDTLKRAIKDYPELANIKKGDEFDAGVLALKAANPQYLSHIQRSISRSPEFFYLSSKPDIAKFARELLELEASHPFYVSSCGMIFAHPHAKDTKSSYHVELDWHTDVFFTIPRSQFIHIWSPFVHDATKELGTILVCPGSHKAGMVKQLMDINTTYNHRYKVDPSVIEQYQPIHVEVKRGSLVIFARDLIHRSGTNISNQVRYAMVGLYHDVKQEAFLPFTTEYKYFGQTPEGYFYEVFGDENAKAIMYEQAAYKGEPRAGV
jgi:ectoine hydroxylase-related dioxygenase (phytanoyl-CoA dioxygenase family)